MQYVYRITYSFPKIECTIFLTTQCKLYTFKTNFYAEAICFTLFILLLYDYHICKREHSCLCLFVSNKACCNNMYDLHCMLTCGNCSNGQQCHHVTGTCPKGCIQGYDGDKCDTSNSFFFFFCNLCLLFVSVLVVIINCFFFFLGLKITYVTAKDQLGIAFYGLLTPLIVSVMCNVWCLIR